MSDIDQANGKHIMVAAVVGATVGAGIALLFAPRSGSETRAWLADRSRRIKDQTTSALDKGKETFNRAVKEFGGDGEDPKSTRY